MTGGPFRRLQELAAGAARQARECSRATKEANLTGYLSECNEHGKEQDRNTR
jgi:hypothetical protein